MAKKAVILTVEGYNKLKEELNYLKNTRRGEILHDLEVAKGFGDLSENAEYDAARTAQGEAEARIKEIEEQLRNAQVFDENSVDEGTVALNSTVTVFDPDEKEETSYIIVGTNEVDAFENKISDMSPIGKAILGHKAGDTVTVETPRGSYTLEIRTVEKTRKN